MTLNTIKIIAVNLFALLLASNQSVIGQSGPTTDYNALSQQLLENIMEGKDTKIIEEALENTTLAALERGLPTDRQKIAFWVNIYNGYIQLILSKNPGLYKDRNEFFKLDQIHIGGRTISFAKIEHGILRKSQWELGLGYFRKWFPDDFERKLRVEEPDYRIHFALNCGAKSCPPVAIYRPSRINQQFNTVTRNYLQQTSSYDKKEGEVVVTALFNWFRGDFEGSPGIRNILAEFNVIPRGADVHLSYKEYDWTLDLNNFTSI